MRKFFLSALFLAFSSSVAAQTVEVRLAGWTKSPIKVEIFTADGVPKGVRNSETFNLTGAHAWDRRNNLVEVEKDVWVDREAVVLQLCGNAPPAPQVSSMAGQVGGQAPRAPIGFGSGSGCPPPAGGPR